MLTVEVNLCPLDTCQEWAEVLVDASEFDPGRGCPAPWDRGESWEEIEVLEIDGQAVGEDWSFMCACGEPCNIAEVQASVANHLRDLA